MNSEIPKMKPVLKVLNHSPVLMLDMNGTFMFGQDRFGPQHDYFLTYVQMGGQTLSREDVTRAVTKCVSFLGEMYVDPDWFDRFPKVTDVLQGPTLKLDLNHKEAFLLEQVIAHHERGTITPDILKVLHQLSQAHRLILVSNIWSQKGNWIEYMKKLGVLSCFEAMVFSSDHGCIKPGHRIYDIALKHAQVPANKIVFIGDNPECDLRVPRELGMSTIRVEGLHAPISHDADWVIGSLTELV